MSNAAAEWNLKNRIFADRVRRARATPIEQKLLEGPQQFDANAQIIKSAIRSQFPDYSEDQTNREYFRRLKIARAIDDSGIYRDAGLIDE